MFYTLPSGVIDSVDTDGWYIPYEAEEAEVQKTTLEQICRDIPVAYIHSIRKCCNVSKDMEEKIYDKLVTIQASLDYNIWR